jgi:hypothetical protein
MSKLRIQDWSGNKREIDFVGYNRDHTACLIRNEQGDRRAIALHLPNRFDLHFHKIPIAPTNSPTLEINRVALHVPACFASKEEKEAYDNPNSEEARTARVMEDGHWELITRHKCWLKPEDDGKLRTLLAEKLEWFRHQYAAREKEIPAWVAKRADPGRRRLETLKQRFAALPPDQTRAAERRLEVCRQKFAGWIMKQEEMKRLAFKREFTKVSLTSHSADSGFRFLSVFDVTLEDVREGMFGLREKLLTQEWAEHYGLNLGAIPSEATAFHIWLEEIAYNASQRATDLRDGSVKIGVCLNLFPWQWEVLEAGVSYEIRFADGTGCWLDDIEERAVTDPTEIEDFDRFEAEAKRKDAEELLRQRKAVEATAAENLAKSETVAGRLEAVVPKLAAERQQLEAVPGQLAACTKDLNDTLGKVPELFADPLVAAARDASIKQNVPEEVVYWVLYEWRFSKFPTVDGAFRRSGLRPKFERT